MTRRDAVYLSQGAPERSPEFLEVGHLAATDTEKREVSGLLLPYGEDLERPDWFSGASKQRFAPGSATVRDNAALFYGHDHLTKGLPIGRIVSHEHTDKGLKITARISSTPKGDEVYTLVKDGVLNKFSAGFYPSKSHLEDNDSTLVHDDVDLFEGSIVPDPAYQSADLDSVLSKTPTPRKAPPMKMTPEQRARLAALRAQETLSHAEASELHNLTTLEAADKPEGLASAADVSALSGAVEDLTRKVATLGNTSPGHDGPVVPYRSYGEFLQGLARDEKEAADFLAYVGGNTDDLGPLMKDSWVGDRYKFIEAQRTVLNLFSTSPLPATGMGVEYGIEGTDTTQVAEQVNEGDTLVYGKITFDTTHKPLKTYGGWGEMSRQQIERSPVNVVERFYNALLRRYAQTTEAAASAEALAAGTALTGGVLDLTTADGWIKFVIRAAHVMKDRGYPLEFLAVGWDVFEDLATLRDGDNADAPRLLDRNSGTVNIVGLRGDMFSIPVVPLSTGATTKVVRACNSEAIRTYEAGGAPFRLQDDDITNLTKAFSVYGYAMTALEVPGAIVKPQTA